MSSRIKKDYALAYRRQGLQYRFLNNTFRGQQSFRCLTRREETLPAYIDLGLLTIHGRDDLLDERMLTAVELRTAENHFRRAIELSPTIGMRTAAWVTFFTSAESGGRRPTCWERHGP